MADITILGYSIWSYIGMLAFLILGPVLGCLLAGLDRKLSARMQGRVGPPILQPLYDVRKLTDKESATVNGAQDLYIGVYLAAVILAGMAFFAGANFLLCVFLLTLGSLFLILAAYASRSPYAELGAQREIIQVMSYEPMVLLVAIGMYMATGSFTVKNVVFAEQPLVCAIPLLFIGFLYVLTIKLRKSPFDISASEHAHQELVRGLTTELSGTTLALYEISHWYETVLFLGWTAMFVMWGGGAVAVVVAVAVALVVWLAEVVVDNNFARVRWQTMLASAWAVALACGAVNVVYLLFV